MNKTVVLGMLAVAGLAASATAQTTPAQIELRIVVDGHADAPVGANITAFLPGPGATRVGLTVQARLLTFGAPIGTLGPAHNYGIASFGSPSSSNLSRISHNDAVSNGYVDSLRRANTGPGTVTRGAMNPFRYFVTGTAANNPETGNPAGAALPSTNTNNGFINQAANLRTQIQAMLSARNMLDNWGSVDDGLGNPILPPNLVTNFPDFGVGTNAAPATSPFQSLYRFYFDPRPNTTDLPRNVTVTVSGRITGMLLIVLNEAVPGPSGLGTYGPILTQHIAVGNPYDLTRDVTFQVPTPGAIALLGLGGLIAGRRRRA